MQVICQCILAIHLVPYNCHFHNNNNYNSKHLRCGNRKGLLGRNDQTHHRMDPNTMASRPPTKQYFTDTRHVSSQDRAHDQEHHPLHRLQWHGNLFETMTITTGWRCTRTMQRTQPQRDICNKTQPPWNVATMECGNSGKMPPSTCKLQLPVLLDGLMFVKKRKSYLFVEGIMSAETPKTNKHKFKVRQP